MAAEQPMASAPTDGTHVLVKATVFGFVPDRQGFRSHKPIGSRWVECRYHDGRWQEWAGRLDSQSTASIQPIKWAPLPEDEQQ